MNPKTSQAFEPKKYQVKFGFQPPAMHRSRATSPMLREGSRRTTQHICCIRGCTDCNTTCQGFSAPGLGRRPSNATLLYWEPRSQGSGFVLAASAPPGATGERPRPLNPTPEPKPLCNPTNVLYLMNLTVWQSEVESRAGDASITAYYHLCRTEAV